MLIRPRTSKSIRIKPREKIITYWTNINDPGSRNVPHSHKHSSFSGVYYLQANDTGAIVFLNSANVLSDCNILSPFTCHKVFEPNDGDLFIWPSWIPHEVDQNTSNKQRINIAFNIDL